MECGEKESVRPDYEGGADLLNRRLSFCASARDGRCLAERRNLLFDVVGAFSKLARTSASPVGL